MPTLLTQVQGQLGMKLRSILEKGKSELGKVDDIYNDAEIRYVLHNDLDITNLNDVLDYIDQYKPDAIINCAAYTNVDKCEKDIDNAYKEK